MSNMTKQYKQTIKYLVEKKKKFFISEKCLWRLIKFYSIFIGCVVFLFSCELQQKKITKFPFSYDCGIILFSAFSAVR